MRNKADVMLKGSHTKGINQVNYTAISETDNIEQIMVVEREYYIKDSGCNVQIH